MGFRRRDEGQPVFDPMSTILATIGQFVGQYGAQQMQQQTDQGALTQQRADQDRAAIIAALSDPNVKLTPEQRAQYGAMAQNLGNVVTGDPLAAQEGYAGITGGGTTTAGQAAADLSRMVGVGGQQREKAVNVADRNAQLRQLMTVQDDQQAFTAQQNTQDRTANRNDAVFTANLQSLQTNQQIIADPAASEEEKAAARASIETAVKELPGLANFYIGKDVTNERAQAAREAGFDLEILARDGAEINNQAGRLANDSTEFGLKVAHHDFKQQKFNEVTEHAATLAEAMQAGDRFTIQRYANIVNNKLLYPEEYEQLMAAGIDGAAIAKATGFAGRVLSNQENMAAVQLKTGQAALREMATAEEINQLSLTKSYADQFQTPAQLNQFLKAHPQLKKQWEKSGRMGMLTNTVRKNDLLYRKNEAATDMKMMLEGPIPSDPEAWRIAFVEAAQQGGVRPAVAQATAEQAINGWSMQGEEWDAKMALTGLESDLLRENVLMQREQLRFLPQQQQMEVEAHRSGLATDASNRIATSVSVAGERQRQSYVDDEQARAQETHTDNLATGRVNRNATRENTRSAEIDNQTRGRMNRATLSSLEAEDELRAAQTAYEQARTADYPNEAAERTALNDANIRLRTAQEGAANALAAQREADAAGGGAGSGGIRAADISAQREVIESEIQAIANSTDAIQNACYVTPSEEMQTLRAFGVTANPEAVAGGQFAEGGACASIQQQIDVKAYELTELGETSMLQLLNQLPVTIGGQQDFLTPKAYSVGRQLLSLKQQHDAMRPGPDKQDLYRRITTMQPQFLSLIPGASETEADDIINALMSAP